MASPAGALAVIRGYRPTLKGSHERIAFAIHAVFEAAGYSLTGAGSKTPLGAIPDQEKEDVGIEGWNDGDGVFTFRYSGASRPDLAKYVVVRMISIDDMLMVDATRLTETQDYLESPEAPFHLGIKVSTYAKETDEPNYQDPFNDFEGLVTLVHQGILSELSKHRVASSNVVEADPTKRRKSPWSEPGPVPRSPAYVGTDIFPEAGVGVFHRGHPRGYAREMIFGPNDLRWSRFPLNGRGPPREPS